jgi:hypothetical protein
MPPRRPHHEVNPHHERDEPRYKDHSSYSEKPNSPRKKSRNLLKLFQNSRPETNSHDSHRGAPSRGSSRAQTQHSQHSYSEADLQVMLANFLAINMLVDRSHVQLQNLATTLVDLHKNYDPNETGSKIGKQIQKLARMVERAEGLHVKVEDGLKAQQKSFKKANGLNTIESQPKAQLKFEEKAKKDILAWLEGINTMATGYLTGYKKFGGSQTPKFIDLLKSLASRNDLESYEYFNAVTDHSRR